MRHEPLLENGSRQRALNLFRAIALSGAMLLAGGCLYHMPIQQGNFLDPGQVEQLQTGMTRSQVRFLLGTPMVPSGFDQDRWDYYYYVKVGRTWKPETKRLSVWFKDDKVDHVERSDAPAPAASPVAEPAAASPAEPAATPAPATSATP
ncbi:MAG: outer membrane protein assembly factor BamE [Proteobacteria bacterium]|nr:outer membrane protein assembly factor BamE [Pseudomonadota bacterium]